MFEKVYALKWSLDKLENLGLLLLVELDLFLLPSTDLLVIPLPTIKVGSKVVFEF